jgi:magnesium chelatase subunit I
VAVPRISDLGAVVASTVGKIELETAGDDVPEERVVERLITKAVFTTFGRHFNLEGLVELVAAFDAGLVLETGDRLPSADYARHLADVPGLRAAVRRLGVTERSDPAVLASALELVLEGLHLSRRVNKDRTSAGTVYRR